MTCDYDYSCLEQGGMNQTCIKNTCQCKPNYELTDKYPFCAYYQCFNDFECLALTGDQNRICSNNECVCEYFESSLNYQCMDETYFGDWGLWKIPIYLSVVICLPIFTCIIMWITCSFLDRRRRNRRLSQIITSQNTIGIVGTQNVLQGMPTPPPPYSRY